MVRSSVDDLLTMAMAAEVEDLQVGHRYQLSTGSDTGAGDDGEECTDGVSADGGSSSRTASEELLDLAGRRTRGRCGIRIEGDAPHKDGYGRGQLGQ